MEVRVYNSTVRVAESILKIILTALRGIIYTTILIAIIYITIIIPIIYLYHQAHHQVRAG